MHTTSGFIELNQKNKHMDEEDTRRLRQRITELEAKLDASTSLVKDLKENSLRYVRILAMVSDAAILTRQGKIVFANAAALELHGATSPEQLAGKRLLDFVHPDHYEITLARIEAQNAGETLPPTEQMRVRLDGSVFCAEVHASAIPWQGKPAMVVILRDLTERIEAKRALQESEEKLRKVFEATGIGISIRNVRDRSIVTNNAICELIGYSQEELEALHFDDITHPDDAQKNRRLHAQLLAGEIESYQLTKRFIHKNGKPIWVLNDLSVVRDDQGKPHYSINLFQDLTQQKLAEQQIRQAQKMESLGTLAGGVAHELNNILLPIQGLTELTRDMVPDGSPAYRNLSVVLKNSKRASELVDKILSFSHQTDPACKRIDLARLIKEEMQLLKTVLPATIDVRVDTEECPITVLADETQIHQVLMNLASNAAHAMGGKVGAITISVRSAVIWDAATCSRLELESRTYAKLSVQDTGHGMDKDTLERIFDPFFTTKPVGKGTGMGLALIHGVITGHGGAIDVSSKRGVGTTFDVYLPLAEDIKPALVANG